MLVPVDRQVRVHVAVRRHLHRKAVSVREEQLDVLVAILLHQVAVVERVHRDLAEVQDRRAAADGLAQAHLPLAPLRHAHAGARLIPAEELEAAVQRVRHLRQEPLLARLVVVGVPVLPILLRGLLGIVLEQELERPAVAHVLHGLAEDGVAQQLQQVLLRRALRHLAPLHQAHDVAPQPRLLPEADHAVHLVDHHAAVLHVTLEGAVVQRVALALPQVGHQLHVLQRLGLALGAGALLQDVRREHVGRHLHRLGGRGVLVQPVVGLLREVGRHRERVARGRLLGNRHDPLLQPRAPRLQRLALTTLPRLHVVVLEVPHGQAVAHGAGVQRDGVHVQQEALRLLRVPRLRDVRVVGAGHAVRSHGDAAPDGVLDLPRDRQVLGLVVHNLTLPILARQITHPRVLGELQHHLAVLERAVPAVGRQRQVPGRVQPLRRHAVVPEVLEHVVQLHHVAPQVQVVVLAEPGHAEEAPHPLRVRVVRRLARLVCQVALEP